MAIVKEKELPNGAVGEYWKITSLNVDLSSMELRAVITLFKDAAKATANRSLGLRKTYRFSISEMESDDNLIELAYNKIKIKAASQVSVDELGNPITPRDYDSDLSNGEDA